MTRLHELERAASPEAAAEAVERAMGLPHAPPTVVQRVARLAQTAARPDLLEALEALRSRHRDPSAALTTAIACLELHAWGLAIAEACGLELDASTRARGHVTASGTMEGREVSIHLTPVGTTVTVSVPEVGWSQSLLPVPDAAALKLPEHVAVWHAATRAALSLLAEHDVEVTMGHRNLRVTGPPLPSRYVIDIVHDTLAVATTLAHRPTPTPLRLEEALAAEHDDAWRLAFATARLEAHMRHRRSFARPLLTDPEPHMRALAARVTEHAPTWRALAVEPGLPSALREEAFHRLRDAPDLTQAIGDAFRMGFDLAPSHRHWLLARVLRDAHPDQEPMVILALEAGDAAMQHDAITVLERIGTVAAVEPLRRAQAASIGAAGVRASERAIAAIQQRAGPLQGALSLVPTLQGGEVGLATPDAASSGSPSPPPGSAPPGS